MPTCLSGLVETRMAPKLYSLRLPVIRPERIALSTLVLTTGIGLERHRCVTFASLSFVS